MQVEDALLAMQRWPFDPAAIRVPVQLWYGRLDSSPCTRWTSEPPVARQKCWREANEKMGKCNRQCEEDRGGITTINPIFP